MNLHHDKAVFRELINGAANELCIPTNIIEKDYYVTLTLRALYMRLGDMVFKGGTSLTKCYQLLNRFSEDIDISYNAESGIPGEARRKKLKKAVVESMTSLGFIIDNLNETRSRRYYNCYRVNYPSIYDESVFLKPELIVETYVALLPFPTEIRMVDNYLYRFLKKIDALYIAEQYELMPFPVTVQTLERTLIDKVYAICDYYLAGKTDRHSRHIYDIYQIYNKIEISDKFNDLVSEVRSARAELPVCPSAESNVSINMLLAEIIDKGVYKKDYQDITEKLLFKPLPYEMAIDGLKAIVGARLFI